MKKAKRSNPNSSPHSEGNDEATSKTSSSSTWSDKLTKNEELPDASSEKNETGSSGNGQRSPGPS